jgi:hypothetical protein
LLQHEPEVLDSNIQTCVVRQLGLGAIFSNPFSRLLGDVPSSLVLAETYVQLQKGYPFEWLGVISDTNQPAMYSRR